MGQLERTFGRAVPAAAAIATALLLALGLAAPAQAMAIASAESEGTLTIVEIICTPGADACEDGELGISLEDNFVSAADVLETGSGSANASGAPVPVVDSGAGDLPIVLGLDSVVSNAAIASANATFDGLGDALTETDLYLAVENGSADDTYAVSFELAYELAAIATIDFAVGEIAFSSATLEIEDDLGDVSESIEVSAHARDASGPGDASGALRFTLTLGPGKGTGLEMLVDAEATAAAVAAPAPLALLAPALVGLLARRRRRGTADRSRMERIGAPAARIRGAHGGR